MLNIPNKRTHPYHPTGQLWDCSYASLLCDAASHSQNNSWNQCHRSHVYKQKYSGVRACLQPWNYQRDQHFQSMVSDPITQGSFFILI